MGRNKRKSAGPRQWSAAAGARWARDARIATARYLREAPFARSWEAAKLTEAHQNRAMHFRRQVPDSDRSAADVTAAAVVITGLGYPETWRPASWEVVAERVVADQAQSLAGADLYILSPEMCDVVIAAAQTLTLDDLSLLSDDDLPSLSGLVVLPHPLLVRAVSGGLGDDRAYQWHAPVTMPRPTSGGEFEQAPAVRITSYHDTFGPVRPDTFVALRQHAHDQGNPLPPLLTDGIRCMPFQYAATEEQLRNHAQFSATLRATGERMRSHAELWGLDEDGVTGEYTPGSEIDDTDDSFCMRFLYAFWRLCEQRITTTSDVEARHAARLAAERAGVSPEVRVVRLRPANTTAGDAAAGEGRDWQHRWIVRMHKVRQWYPSEQRHKVLYRGPYIKGPADKPLLGGETVRGLVR
ncbi:hypothetical protein [Prauserella muralis]|uniref:Uncharacterized protein n=2 Tax=Prauserella muralis TaxID=588067 RepID=A0A2V4ACK1_9PSEU|nr:hypothetical protein [Prauserella muralis]PXY16625.1 hypothetical protein BAY60_36150 [Prauserella muralis]TWE11125.1 hypothetical protein FHX69_7344 [Prauserella muralis]